MSRISIVLALLLAATAAASGCTKSQTAAAGAAPEATPGAAERQTMGPGMMGTGDSCPMIVPGTSVQVTDTGDGATMTFTTTAGDVSTLRSRVHSMAERMNAHPGTGMGTGMGMGMMGSGMDMMGARDGGSGMMGGGPMPAMHAQAEDVEDGARLRMTPADPARLAEMRQRMQQHAQTMNQSHACPMTGR
ncbi:MAG TPA: hypothetical protein VE987_12700 [Polyangiaceae bacterium]|nr:hypothetical protein [Polyangiaceae bacterium]